MVNRTGAFVIIVAIAACAVLATACQDEERLGTRLELAPASFRVDAGLNPVLAHSYVLPDLPTERVRFETQTGRAWDSWTSVNPWRASLVIQEPGLNWGFAQEISIQAYTDDVSARREIFYRDQIRADAGSRLDLVPSETNVLDLFAGERVSLVIEFRRLAASPPQSIPAVLTWSLNAKD